MTEAKVVEGIVIPGNVGWVVRINLVTAALNLVIFAAVGTPVSYLSPELKRLLMMFQQLANEDDEESAPVSLIPERHTRATGDETPVAGSAATADSVYTFPTEAVRYLRFVAVALMLATALSAYGLAVQVPLLVWLAGNHPTTPWLRSWWQRFRFSSAVSPGLERGSRIALLAQLPVWWAFSTAIGLWRLAQDEPMQSIGQLERPRNAWHNPEATVAAAPATTTATASRSYGTLAVSSSPAMVSSCPSTSLWVVLRGWPRSGWNTHRIKAALAILYPPEAVLGVELIYRGRPAELERQRLARYLQARYTYLASLPTEEMRIPLRRWRWTLHPGMQRRLCEQWRQTELARLSGALERLQVEHGTQLTSTDTLEHFSGWVLVRFRDPYWCKQCFCDFGPSSARLGHVVNRFSWRRYRAHDANGDHWRQALLDAPSSAGGEAGADSLTAQARKRRIKNHPVLRRLRAETVPSLSDIQWSHLGMPRWERWLREGSLNLLFGFFLIFLSSPVEILSVLQVVAASAARVGPASLEALVLRLHRWSPRWSHRVGSLSRRVWIFSSGIQLCGRGNTWRMRLQQVVVRAMVVSDTPTKPLSWSGVFLFSYLPVGLLMLINNAVPWMLRILGAREGHPTRSAEETSVLRKSIAYYLLNTLFLPSLAMNTAAEIILLAYRQSLGGQMPQRALAVAERIFRGDNAFFYANFLIQLALTGNTLALLHPMHWLRFFWSRREAFTPLALAEACQAAPFDYPYAYAQVIKVLSIGFFLGPFVPLLWPFVWLYLVTRYAVDRYNLRWVHPPSHKDERISRAATNAASAVLVIAISILMLLSWLYDNFMLLGILLASLLYLMSLSLSVCWYPRALRPLHRISEFLLSRV